MPIVELPQLPRREPTCPAALKIHGVTRYDGGCVCRIMERDQQVEDGIGMDPAQLEVAREGIGGVYMTVKSDPGTVLRLCFGEGVPVITSEDGQRRDHHSYCPIFERYKDRIAEHRRKLFDPVVEDGVSMGMPEPQVVGDWEGAGLDELAPAPRAA